MYLCIDIGGTKTLIALVNHRGKILHSIKFETIKDQKLFYEHLVSQIRVNFSMSDVDMISVAMPGVVKDNVAIYLGNLPWKDFDIAHLLQCDSDKPVVVENDANLAALAEAHKSPLRSLYFTFSTGIGGGVVSDGRILKGYHDFEPGHTIYTYHGTKKEWEDIAAASAINQAYGKHVTSIKDKAAWADIVERMLLGLIPYTASIKPDRIIFGGPLGLMLPRYRRSLRKQLTEQLPKNVRTPKLVKARYGSFSVIHGCYLNAKAHQTTK